MSHTVEVAPEVGPPVATREDRFRSGLPRWQGAVLLVLIGWLYWSILGRLFLQWVGHGRDPNFEHGIFVPLFAAYVLWLERKNLKAISPAPSWAGLPLELVGLIMLVLGILGVELFFSRSSLLVVLAGLIILFQGWTFFRAVLFPWAFLFLMIPIPTLIISEITFPLQLLASKLATELLELVGVPVLRHGNLILLPAMTLNVAEACSGIRSLLTLVTLAVIYGYLMETRNWVRVLLVGLAVPIAVAANAFRIFGTGLLVQYWDPEKAEGFYHSLGGELIFVVALVMLFAAHRAITSIWKSGPRKAADDRAAVRDTPARRETPDKNEPLRFALAAGLLLATAIGLQAHAHSEIFPQRAPLASLPLEIDGWKGTDNTIDEASLNILGHPEYILRDYVDPGQTQPWIEIYIAYFPSQSAGDTIHSPAHCLPGNGWIPSDRKVVQIAGPDGSTFPVNRYVGAIGGEKPELVLFWFQAHGRAVSSGLDAKYYLFYDSIKMNRSDGALIRLRTPLLDGETAEAAQARVMKLGTPLLPMLDRYIPR